MNVYYTKKGRVLGRAWSTMTCLAVSKGEKHPPHSHDPQFASYGPYMCEGFPKKRLYLTKPRTPVNG